MPLESILPLLTTYKYLLLFPIVVVEGPIITVIAGLLSALGFLNIYAVYVVVVVGDLTGDSFSYVLGRYGGTAILAKWGRYFGVKVASVKKFETHFKRNSALTIIGGKFAYAMEMPFLIAAGIAKVPYGKFFLYTLIPTLPKSLLFLAIGYYFGASYSKIDGYLNYLAFVIVSGVLIFVVSLFVVKKIRMKIKEE